MFNGQEALPKSKKGVYYEENQKFHQMFEHLFKANLILLVNTLTLGQYTDSSPYTVSLRVITCRSVASLQ